MTREHVSPMAEDPAGIGPAASAGRHPPQPGSVSSVGELDELLLAIAQ